MNTDQPGQNASGRKIIHIDMDAFYASVEQRDDPRLRGKPVIVGGTPENRGVVAAASYEVRAFGVHSAMPTSRALRLCPDAILVRPRIPHYAEISRQIGEINRQYTDLVEPLSLDECFLDVTDNKRGIPFASAIARELRGRIRAEIGLTASAGVAPNKFLAKIASDLHKPDGLVVIRPDEVQRFLEPLPVERVWGVGPATAGEMHRIGVRTIGDLARVPAEALIARFGKSGELFARLARGEDDRPVQAEQRRKSVSQETTFPRDVSDLQALRETIVELADEVWQYCLRKQIQGSTVTVKVRYADFTTVTRSHTVPFPISSRAGLVAEGFQLIEKTQAGAIPVRLVGIGLSSLVAMDGLRQLMLFDPLGTTET